MLGVFLSRVLVVGAGLSGAVVARLLAEAGYKCLVVDERNHVGGNCHTSIDAATGILVHRYGPHIFHTDDAEIWDFMSRFGAWEPYRHRVFATTAGRVFSLPINLLTINQFFGTALGPEEARALIASKTVPIGQPVTFHEQALSMFGEELYEAFFRHYTEKQWGVDADRLPASVLKRLPLRFTYDNNYFHHSRQAMPREGYTAIVETMLAHEHIEVMLGCPAEVLAEDFRHAFYTGGIDRYFGYRLGHLGYRSLRFEEIRPKGDILGCPVMNFPGAGVPYTRMTDHAHLSPWRERPTDISIVWKEYPEAAVPGGPLFYPLRLAGDERLLREYVALAHSQPGVTFLGRLGCYAYIDMDMAVRRAIDTAQSALLAFAEGAAPPAFVHEPLSKA